MSEFAFLPLSTDAYLADTRHLNAQQHGAYLLLLMTAWRTPDCRLPDDDDLLARWAAVDRRTWLRIKPTIMMFWTIESGRWSQKRLLKEREYVSKRAEVARENGARGGRPKPLINIEQANPAGSSRGTQPETTLTLTPLKTPIVPKGTGKPRGKKDAGYGVASDPVFADFEANIWSKRWQRPSNNPRDAFCAYAKLSDIERSACKAGIEHSGRAIVADSSEAKFRPMLSTWINKRGWEAEPADGTIQAKAIDWAKNVAYFRDTGEWPTGWGPRPGDPGCKAPRELLVGLAAA